MNVITEMRCVHKICYLHFYNFQQYFSYIVAVNSISERNLSTWRKPVVSN